VVSTIIWRNVIFAVHSAWLANFWDHFFWQTRAKIIFVRFWFLVFLLNYTSFFLHNVSMKVRAISQWIIQCCHTLGQYWKQLSARTKHTEWNCAPLARTWNKTVHPCRVHVLRYLWFDLPSGPLLTILNEIKLKIYFQNASFCTCQIHWMKLKIFA
jgi:hypothetical protein